MNRLAKLQLFGPLALALMIAAEEAAAYALALKPSSTVAWYLNLEIFAVFQRSHYLLSDKFDIPYLQFLAVAVPVFALASAGFVLRRPLMAAAATNLSFVYVVFLAFAWHAVETPALVTATLEPSRSLAAFGWSALTLGSGPHVFVLVVMLIPALLSFVVSHLFYLRAVYKRSRETGLSLIAPKIQHQ
jgi:hypothetical protein